MMDCKKALTETNGDMAAAQDLLRVKGLAKAAKKADRVASEGVVAVAASRASMRRNGCGDRAELGTDFVARNETFQAAARQIANAAVEVDGDVEALRSAKVDGGQTADELIGGLIATIGENMTLRRAARLHGRRGRRLCAQQGARRDRSWPDGRDRGRRGRG